MPLAQAHGLALLPWSPLAGGILAGRYATKGRHPAGSRRTHQRTFRNRITQRGIEVAVAVAEMAAERKLTPSQLALLWVMDQPGITSPILGRAPYSTWRMRCPARHAAGRRRPPALRRWSIPAPPWPISTTATTG